MIWPVRAGTLTFQRNPRAAAHPIHTDQARHHPTGYLASIYDTLLSSQGTDAHPPRHHNPAGGNRPNLALSNLPVKRGLAACSSGNVCRGLLSRAARTCRASAAARSCPRDGPPCRCPFLPARATARTVRRAPRVVKSGRVLALAPGTRGSRSGIATGWPASRRAAASVPHAPRHGRRDSSIEVRAPNGALEAPRSVGVRAPRAGRRGFPRDHGRRVPSSEEPDPVDSSARRT